jgi:hypothetical protein
MLSLMTLAACIAVGEADRPDAEAFFENKIRPVLTGTCFRCHGGKKVRGGLRVDSRAALVRGGDRGPAFVPGDPERSLLVQAVRYAHPDIKMPPDKRLPDAVAANLAAWVKQGAPWPTHAARAFGSKPHWAFVPVKKVDPPFDPTGWSDTPVDRFMAAKWRALRLHPAPLADRRTLLRRLSFDLIGLPPSPQEMQAFLADDSPTAYAKVVDRLLASQQYGERWGRHWLDVARYADTAGDNADYPVPEARLYRDYVIDSFNADKPYDQFVREQLAGDILALQGPRELYATRVIATGFLALSRRYATAPYELWHLTLEDAIATTGRAFLALTLRCARCHDHKFDPVTRADYYALYGIFASTQFPWTGAEEFASKKLPREHLVPLLPPAEAAPRLEAFRNKMRQLHEEIRRLETMGPGINHQSQSDLDRSRRLLQSLIKAGLPADVPGAYAVQEGKPEDAFIQLRGEPEQRGPIVPRNVPQFLAGKGPFQVPPGSSGRLPWAEWLTRPENPLTARVMVNRIWQHHFGKGLVATPSNFGTRGEPPTHPELLDWLAARFIAGGWSVKAIHRQIVLSKTYRLAGADEDANLVKDPANRWYWRYDRRRLDAEAIRDAMLAVSGRLDRQRPGPHPFPRVEQWGWTQHNPFKAVYPSNHRTVYLMTQRIQRHPFLALFDGPDTNTTSARRGISTVPQQALFLMNNPFVHEQAEAFARRLMAAAPKTSPRTDLAYQLAWSRPATAAEQNLSGRFIRSYRQELAKLGVYGEQQEREAWTSYARVLLSGNAFLYLD